MRQRVRCCFGTIAAGVATGLKLLMWRLPDRPVNRIEELLPWNVAAQLPALKAAA